jgi:hypothetical protein
LAYCHDLAIAGRIRKQEAKTLGLEEDSPGLFRFKGQQPHVQIPVPLPIVSNQSAATFERPTNNPNKSKLGGLDTKSYQPALIAQGGGTHWHTELQYLKPNLLGKLTTQDIRSKPAPQHEKSEEILQVNIGTIIPKPLFQLANPNEQMKCRIPDHPPHFCASNDDLHRPCQSSYLVCNCRAVTEDWETHILFLCRPCGYIRHVMPKTQEENIEALAERLRSPVDFKTTWWCGGCTGFHDHMDAKNLKSCLCGMKAIIPDPNSGTAGGIQCLGCSFVYRFINLDRYVATRFEHQMVSTNIPRQSFVQKNSTARTENNRAAIGLPPVIHSFPLR